MRRVTRMILGAGILFLALAGPVIVKAQQDAPDRGPDKPALLVIDIQNAYLPYMSQDDQSWVMEIINGAIYTFGQHHLPVIKIHHSDLQWGPEPGTEAFAFPESVLTADGEIQVIKHYPSAFQQTNLDSILQANGCNTLYLCGLSATGCVLATYFGAKERNYPVMMIKEGILSHDKAYTRMVNDICESVSFMTMTRMLGK